ncbi:MAG: TIGR02757 family protein [Bacteroidales bacterium]|nr:TIGR02757 family protein [Bacteroidales bacterium]
MDTSLLKEFLEEKSSFYNTTRFIDPDPISIPHLYTRTEDIEIAGFLTATIAWGNRKSIIQNARRMMMLMGNNPYEFILNADDESISRLAGFCHRTFNGTDLAGFVIALRYMYSKYKSLGLFFEKTFQIKQNIKDTLLHFREEFILEPFPERTRKHIADVSKNASAKRLNMFLRWMVRKDNRGVDFGLWNIPSSALYIPLDVHSGNVARKLGLLKRRQNDWQAVEELTSALKVFDPEDPVKYDFALFGLGVSEEF